MVISKIYYTMYLTTLQLYLDELVLRVLITKIYTFVNTLTSYTTVCVRIVVTRYIRL